MNPPVKFEVKPTSITGHSILVLPSPGYHTPRLSLQMETELANRLAHAANTLPKLVEALKSLADKDGKFRNWENGEGESLDEKLNAALAAAEEVIP